MKIEGVLVVVENNKYSIGDKVTIKHDLESNWDLDIIDEMLEYKGQIATILSISKSKIGETIIYKLDIDHKFWKWYSYCFEEVLS